MTHRFLALVGLWLVGCTPLPDSETVKGDPGGGGPVSAEDTGEAGGSGDGGGSGSGGSSGGGGGSDTGSTSRPEPFSDGPVKGVWVTRWSYSSEGDVETIIEEVADAGFTHVFFQVRGRFDAYYNSGVEPWAERLSGSLGTDPGWDPLATAIAAGAARDVEIHAYLNTFPFWSGTTAPASSSPTHAYRAHPEWVVHDDSGTPMALNSSYVYASPGNPAVRDHIAAVVADLVGRYDVDGVHLDYIRYPGPQYSHDPESLAAHAADGGDWDDWRRQQVLSTVAAVRAETDLPLTAAVWGIYEDRWSWGASQGNVDYFQDSRAMLQDGLLDAIIPMIYWPVTEPAGGRLDFRTLLVDHLEARSLGGKVFAGFGNTVTPEEAARCVEVSAEEGADGVVLFDWSVYRDSLDQLSLDVWED